MGVPPKSPKKGGPRRAGKVRWPTWWTSYFGETKRFGSMVGKIVFTTWELHVWKQAVDKIGCVFLGLSYHCLSILKWFYAQDLSVWVENPMQIRPCTGELEFSSPWWPSHKPLRSWNHPDAVGIFHHGVLDSCRWWSADVIGEDGQHTTYHQGIRKFGFEKKWSPN